jgi:hypothetical protein
MGVAIGGLATSSNVSNPEQVFFPDGIRRQPKISLK